MPERRTAATPIPFVSRELADITQNELGLPGLPPWLGAFVRDAMQETGTLRENGAEQAAVARTALLQKLIGAARAWLDAELDLHEAAQETGRCEETIRRAVRAGSIPDRRANRNGRHRIRRGDLQSVATPERPPYDPTYDPTADAQSIAQLRRRL
jgi:hypothetical protein